MLPVLDRDVERVAARVEVGDDGVHRPVAVGVDDVARVAVREQLGVVARVVRPRLGPARPRARRRREASARQASARRARAARRARSPAQAIRRAAAPLFDSRTAPSSSRRTAATPTSPAELVRDLVGVHTFRCAEKRLWFRYAENCRRRQDRRPPPPAARRCRRLAWLIGPALVAGVAYLDPGNVASNMTAGARYGYLLVWVVVLGNVMAWLIQYLSAKLGIVTGRSLPETLGRPHPHRVGPSRLLAAGRARRDGDRHRRGDRRRRRAEPAVRHPAALGRRHHRHRVDRAAADPVAPRAAAASSSSSSACSRSSRSASRSACSSAPPDGASVVGGPRAALRGHRLGAAGGIDPRAPRSCRTRSTRTARWRGTASRRRRRPPGVERRGARRPPSDRPAPIRIDDPARASCAASRPRRLLRATKWDVSIAMLIAGTVNLCILLLAAANLAGVPGTDTLEGAYAALYAGLGSARRDAVRGRPARERPRQRRRSAPTPAPRSCTACCTSACRSSPGAWSR